MAFVVVPDFIEFTPPEDDSVTEFVRSIGPVAAHAVNSGSQFIQGLVDSKSISFNVGDLPALGYGFLNDTDALIAAAEDQPTRPTALDFTEIEGALDELGALSAPGAPTLVTPNVVVPNLDASAPIVTLPSVPNADTGAPPGAAPEVLDPTIPDEPLFSLPTVPSFEDLALPEPPVVTLPSFSATAPVNTLVAPSATFAYVEPEYVSQLQDPYVAKLLSDLINGGYGIDESDETRLWNRARDREQQLASLDIEEIKRTAASTSLGIPQGALFAQIEMARQKLMEKVSSANREIAIKRGDMYVENRRFTLQEVRQWEQVAISLFNSIADRALNVEKARVDLAVAIYDAQVRNFNTQLESYKTEATVFEAKIRASLSAIELYRAQLQASNQRMEMQRVKVQLYQAQLDGVNSIVNIYRTRMEAANIFAAVQRSKLEVFRTQVEAYGERVRAKQAEFSMYESAVRGQMAQVDIYKTQIQAYNARLEGVRTTSEIAVQQNQVLSQQYAAQVEQYRAQMQGLVSEVNGRIEKVKSGNDSYRTDVDAYRAYVGALAEGTRVRVHQQHENNEWNKSVLASRVDVVRFQLEKLAREVEHVDKINFSGVDIYKNAIASSLSALTAITVKSA